MSATDEDRPPAWSRMRQDVGVVGWSSFLAACLATMIFFAFFDPLLLASDDSPPAWLENRMTGYGIGFFFWFICAVAGFLTSALLETRTSPGSSDRQGD